VVVVEGGREGRWKIRDSGLVVKTTSGAFMGCYGMVVGLLKLRRAVQLYAFQVLFAVQI
jgi:hypothetical protein